MAGLEPAFSCSQGTRVRRYPTSRSQSERPDLNRGHRPKAGRSCTPSRRDSQTSLRSDLSSSCGSRTRLSGLKGQCPRTDRRTSRSRRAPSTQLTIMVSAQPSRSGSGGARIRVSWSSARRYTLSATDPRTKKARCPCDTGLSILHGDLRPSVTSARDRTGAYSPLDRRRSPYPFVVLHSAVRKSWLSPDSL